MKSMMFNSDKAMAEYVSNPKLSYRSIAEKYNVSLSVVKKAAKEQEWFKKRKEAKLLESEKEKLSLLRKSANRAIEALYSSLSDYELLSINDLKNISSILKTLTAVQRDLNDLPTYKEENTIRISDERLQLVRAKITSKGEDESKTGVVFIPFLDEEDEDDESVIVEGEDDV